MKADWVPLAGRTVTFLPCAAPDRGQAGVPGWRQFGTRGRWVRPPRTEVHTPSLRAAAACRSAEGVSYRVVRCLMGLPSGPAMAAIWLMVLYEPFCDPAI